MIEAVHLKTGNRYRILHYGTDCTNSRDGVQVVIYAREEFLDKIYVRELEEFERKFRID